jgi:methyl-accepting chemotaxis protein
MQTFNISRAGINLRLRDKLILYILLVITLIYIITFGIILSRTKNNGFRDARMLAETFAAKHASQANVIFNSYSSITKTLGDIFERYTDYPEEMRRAIFSGMLKRTLESNPELLSVWSIWETNSMDGFDNVYRNKPGSTILGNFRYEYYKLNNEIRLSEYIEQDSAEVLSGKLYSNLKKNHNELIVDPYFYSYSRKKEEEVLLTNIVRPIMVDGVFNGILGIDFLLESHQKIVEGVHPFEHSQALLVSTDGTIVSVSDRKSIGQKLTSIGYNFEDSSMMKLNIVEGKQFSMMGKDEGGKELLFAFAPIRVGKTTTPWSFCILVPVDVVMQDAATNFMVSLILGLAGIVVLFIVITLVAKYLTKPIERSVDFTRKIATGNLNAVLDVSERKDELGLLMTSLNKMASKIKQIVSGIIDGTANIHVAGKQLDVSSANLSQSSNKLAASVEEVSATIEEMFESIRLNSQLSKSASDFSEKAMAKVRQVSEISALANEASKNISNRISIINDIAFQTNLLALNAAVEAARAGAQGKGFAVVAAEVRKLAERSKLAADEIVGQAQNSLNMSEKTGNYMQSLIPELEKIADIISQISNQGQEQVAATDEINHAMQQINDISQQNAAISEEIASSSEELVAQAGYLKGAVDYFKI